MEEFEELLWVAECVGIDEATIAMIGEMIADDVEYLTQSNSN